MNKFKVAFIGLFNSLKHKAVLIQFVNAILAIVLGLILKLNYYEWIVFIILIILVIGLEIINTCIEKICDFIEPKYDIRIKEIKDMSSAAVLVVSIGAFVIALLVIFNKLGGII